MRMILDLLDWHDGPPDARSVALYRFQNKGYPSARGARTFSPSLGNGRGTWAGGPRGSSDGGFWRLPPPRSLPPVKMPDDMPGFPRPKPTPMPRYSLPTYVRPVREIAPAVQALGWWYARKNPLVLALKLGLMVAENWRPARVVSPYQKGVLLPNYDLPMQTLIDDYGYSVCNDLSVTWMEQGAAYCSHTIIPYGDPVQAHHTIKPGYKGTWKWYHYDGKDGFGRNLSRLCFTMRPDYGEAMLDALVKPPTFPKLSPLPQPVVLPWLEPLRPVNVGALEIPPPVALIPQRNLPETAPGYEGSSGGNGVPGAVGFDPDNPDHAPKPPKPSRPKPGTQETKTRNPLVGVLFNVWDASTEAKDFVDAVADALPKRLQDEMKGMGLVEKALFIGRHIDDLDLPLAIKNVIANQIEDRLIGRVHRAGDKAGVGMGFGGVGYLKKRH